jgi:hypothetical protein
MYTFVVWAVRVASLLLVLLVGMILGSGVSSQEPHVVVAHYQTGSSVWAVPCVASRRVLPEWSCGWTEAMIPDTQDLPQHVDNAVTSTFDKPVTLTGVVSVDGRRTRAKPLASWTHGVERFGGELYLNAECVHKPSPPPSDTMTRLWPLTRNPEHR